VLRWTEPAHAESYELWAASSSAVCRQAAAAGAGADASRLAAPASAERTLVLDGGEASRFVCVAAVGRGPTGEPSRSAASNVIDVTRTPPPPVPVTFDIDGWLARPFDLSWSTCDPTETIPDYALEYMAEDFPDWAPTSLVPLSPEPSWREGGFTAWWYDISPDRERMVSPDGMRGSVTPLTQGDVTGDGRNDALVTVDCYFGANTWLWDLAAFTRDASGAPQLLGIVYGGGGSSQGGVGLDSDVRVVDGQVRIITVERDGPGFDGTAAEEIPRTFRFDGAEFRAGG
jgi:hypothetical protein